jgi:ribosome biogenesis GTPase
VGELSPKLKKGTHTTVEIKLYTINEKTFIVDTPGFSKIDLKTIMKKEDVRNYFKEFKRYICAFRDCLHIAEDGCAVISNLSKDDFLKIKYDSYLKILKEFEL